MTWRDISRDAFTHFRDIEPADLVAALHHRFDVERISKYLRSVPYSFEGAVLNISPDNSILIEFATLQSEYPELYPSKQYRLLLIFSLHQLKGVSTDLALELNTVRRKDNIDRIVLWSCSGYDASTLHTLKNNAIDVIYINEKDVAGTTSISHYIPIANKDHNYALSLNLAADLLVKRLKKMFHLVLSEVAAPIYDRLYGKGKVATDEMMRFEERLVRDVVNRFLPNPSDRKIAVDVGCGTGRHTTPLSKQFDRVYAFDFSPHMIDLAEKKKAAMDVRNILFSVADLEYETVRDEGFFQAGGAGQVDLVVASFGLGSFIEDTSGMMRRFHGWLRENGIAIISFYNRQTILVEVTPNWRDTSLSAHLDTETDTLRVELSPKTVFHIYCRPYGPDVQSTIMEGFDILEITTFPTLMALMPNSLLQSGKALGIFRFVDETLSEHKDYRYGHYVTVVARRRSGPISDALQRIEKELHERNARFELIAHPPVVASEDVRKYVDMGDGLAVKTLLFRRQDDRKLVAVVVPARHRVDSTSLAKRVGVRKLFFASDRDVLATGFPLGGIAPFGFLAGTVERRFVDEAVLKSNSEWIYTGSGDSSRTLKIWKEDLVSILADYEPIHRSAAGT
jgi:prolyl-tRNA editing enzyme YbaK/EbsC (Cys-tRNA(Pro) deacylase)/SAM-dependent methyltransferase